MHALAYDFMHATYLYLLCNKINEQIARIFFIEVAKHFG